MSCSQDLSSKFASLIDLLFYFAFVIVEIMISMDISIHVVVIAVVVLILDEMAHAQDVDSLFLSLFFSSHFTV